MKVAEGFAYTGRIAALVITCSVFLPACQTPRQALPLAYLPTYIDDFKNPMFVENRTLVVQTCLAEKKIGFREQAIAMPAGPMPPTLCKYRESVGQPCPDRWAASEPSDALSPYSAVRTVRVWEPTGANTDLPTRFIPVRHVHRGVVNSAGSSHAYLTDLTTSNQPIFEYVYESNPESLFAWSTVATVNRDGVRQPIYFWFTPPKGLRLNEFSNWQVADAEEKVGTNRSAAIAMANNADFPKSTTGPGSPLVRFGLFTKREYYDSQRLYRYEFRPAQLEVAKNLADNQRETVQILRTTKKAIPSC